MSCLSAFTLLFFFLVFYTLQTNGRDFLLSGCANLNLEKDCTSCNPGHRLLPYFGLCFQISTKSMSSIEAVSGSHRWTVHFLDSNMIRQKDSQVLEEGCDQELNKKCVRCGPRYYKLENSCRLVSITCESWDKSTGECLRCFGGFILSKNECVLQVQNEEQNRKVDEEGITDEIKNKTFQSSSQKIKDENEGSKILNSTRKQNSTHLQHKQEGLTFLNTSNKLDQTQFSNISGQDKLQTSFKQPIENLNSSLKDVFAGSSVNQPISSSSITINFNQSFNIEGKTQDQENTTDLTQKKISTDSDLNLTDQADNNQQSIDPENSLPSIVNENVNINIVQLLKSFPFDLYDSKEQENKTISSEPTNEKNQQQYNKDGEFSLEQFLQSLPQNKDTDLLNIGDFSHLSSSSIQKIGQIQQAENNDYPLNPGYIYYV